MNEGRMVAGSEMKILFPDAGVIRVESAPLFATPDDEACRRFLQAALLVSAIEAAIINTTNTPCIDLYFDVSRH